MFVKIKNWASCIPEEVRKKDEFMPIDAFERVVNPAKVPSPFVHGGGGKGPGGIGEPVERAAGERVEGGGAGRKRTRRQVAEGVQKAATGVVQAGSKYTAPAGTPAPGAVAAAVAGGTATATATGSGTGTGDTKDRTMLTAAGTLSVPPIVDKLPPETSACLPCFCLARAHSHSRRTCARVFRRQRPTLTARPRRTRCSGSRPRRCTPRARRL